jgi:hypothetical protein
VNPKTKENEIGYFPSGSVRVVLEGSIKSRYAKECCDAVRANLVDVIKQLQTCFDSSNGNGGEDVVRDSKTLTMSMQLMSKDVVAFCNATEGSNADPLIEQLLQCARTMTVALASLQQNLQEKRALSTDGNIVKLLDAACDRVVLLTVAIRQFVTIIKS